VARLLARSAPADGAPVQVALGMRYGSPSIGAALRELHAGGCRRLVVLPLYPQYFSGTGGSTFDAVARELAGWRWVPELRMVQHYHDEPGYVAALARSLEEAWADGGRPEKLLFSFHGIPVRYFLAGDPYYCHCQKTARLVAERLELRDGEWEVAFQSLFGREEWIKPYTDRTLQAMARAGIRRVDVLCPGFSADCLETLEEIAGLNRELFEHAGGERLRYVPALNDRPDHLALLAELERRTAGEWLAAPRPEELEDRRRGALRAAAMAAAGSRPADGGYGPSGV
jgi:ferrochelatase